MRIDAHQHFWRLARGDYSWLTPGLKSLYRDFEPQHLQPLLAERGIDGTITVQAAASVAETRHLLALADGHHWIRGVVGWVDFDSPGQALKDLESLRRHKKFVGVRPMIQDIADVDWMLRPEIEPVFRALVRLDLRFDALVKPPHLDNLRRLLGRHPDLRVIVDHGAKPQIALGSTGPHFDRWASSMRAIARETSAFCKLSGLVTEARPNWTFDDLRPFGDELLESFGPERLVFGSDWPVLTLAGGYAQWWETADQLLERCTKAQRTGVFGTNAQRFYF